MAVLTGLALVATAGFLPFNAIADSCQSGGAVAVSVQGEVLAQRAGESRWLPVHRNDSFCPGDTIQTQRRSRLSLALEKSVLRLNANTTLTLKGVRRESGEDLLNITEGAGLFISHAPRSLEIVTPHANVAARGTEFFVGVNGSRTVVSMFQGQILASNQAGSLALASGQSAIAGSGQAPTLSLESRPRDAVRWALHYPPVLDVSPDRFTGAARQSIEAYRKGDIKEAFRHIDAAGDVRDPAFLIYRASLLLSVGRVEEAEIDIAQAQTGATDGGALALQTVIAVVQGDTLRALDLGNKAVSASGGKSAAAHIALSYARQAAFDLRGARRSLQTAVQVEPGHALAWARLAELQSATGSMKQALESAQKAASLNPGLSRTQTVLGFAHLAREQTGAAQEAFNKAIELDQADPLPKLGLGLARIRDDRLAEGRSDLEAAASLDPGSSLVRSYLGKAYYEEKRSDKASDQFARAKENDPKDPTPYLYDAIEKQTTNRPVEALHDMQTAIELNDNRAPFRSRLLLDSDLASRSAAVGRIYTDLGFQNRGLLEGWKSVNTDNSNFAAHRFLADTYAALPRHEIARVSELLQSQLLQPVNMTPVQPRLAESNLFLVSAGGPGATSFNEFNPLFKSNGLTMQTSSLVGKNDTYSAEGIVAGIYRKLSFSVGYSKFDSNGWRQGASQEDDVGNAFLQYEFNPDTSVQAEFRYRDNTFGDLGLRHFTDDFFPTMKIVERFRTLRLGGRHNLAPNQTVLASLIYQRAAAGIIDPNLNDFFKFSQIFFNSEIPNQESYSGELQHLFRSRYINVTSGVGYSDTDGQQVTFISDPGIPVPPFPATSDTQINNIIIRHMNLYSYAQAKPWSNVTLTAGLSWDYVQGDFPGLEGDSQNQVNPKFGVIYEPFKGTTLRAAAFKTLKRTLTTNQTLEPTQVAGFNQFYDDVNLTKSWRFGAGIDQVFTQNFYGGVEYSQRDLRRPYVTGDPPTPLLADWEERMVRAYLYWTPHKWLALRAQYFYEDLDRLNPVDEAAQDAKTHRIPLGISLYHPSGLSASFTETYYNQRGRFGASRQVVFPVPDPILAGSDKFWVADLALSYRLPKRMGFVSLGVSNLFNRKFQYFDSDFNNPGVQPDRMGYARITLQLP